MELLDSYLNAVKRYLPRSQRDDIVSELSVEPRDQIESRESEFGRPLRDSEQMAIFKEQGDPMIVARRYRQNGRSLTIGWELIGPELFPMYLIILSCNLTIAVGMTIGVLLYLREPIGVTALLRPALIQIACVTTIFTVLNLVRGNIQPALPALRTGPVIRSRAGVRLRAGGDGRFTFSWMLITVFPGLLFGSAAGHLGLAPSWHRFYLPVLLLLAMA